MTLIRDGFVLASSDRFSGASSITVPMQGNTYTVRQLLGSDLPYNVNRGFGASTITVTDYSSTSMPPYMRGSASLGGAAAQIRWDFVNGEWDMRSCGSSQYATTTVNFVAFDGPLPYTGTPNLWTPNFSGNVLNAVVMNPNGYSYYRCVKIGTTASSGGPVGTGDGSNIIDGSVEWKWIATPLWVVAPTATGAALATIDANMNIGTSSNWVDTNTSKRINVTKNYITVTKYPGQTGFLNTLMREQVTPILVDLVINDTFGEPLTTLYTGEPAEKRIASLTTLSGASNFTLSGALAPYFTVAYEDSVYWLKSNSTRMPDNLAGTRTLTITQTDLDASITTRVNNLSVTVLSTNNRPLNGITSQYSGRAYYTRNTVKANTTDIAWTGYTNQTFTTDTIATSPTTLLSQFNAISPTGTSWHRITLSGTGSSYNTGITFPDKDFGTGGLLIENTAGQSPKISAQWSGFVKGLHLRGLTMVGNGAVNNFIWRTNKQVGSVALRLKVTGCFIGKYFGDSGETPDTLNSWKTVPNGFLISSAEQVIIEDTRFWGVTDAMGISGTRLAVVARNSCRAVVGDFLKLFATYYDQTPFPYANTNRYAAVIDNSVYDSIDYYDQITASPWEGVHSDFLQNAVFNPYNTGICYGWIPSRAVSATGANNQPRFNIANGNIYECTTSGTTASTGSGPSGTGSSITDGTAVWMYRGPYVDAAEVHLWCEGNLSSASGVKYNTGSNGLGMNTVYRQFYISSNGGCGSPIKGVFLNNISLSNSSYGIHSDDGSLLIEYNNFAFPAETPSVIVSPQTLLANNSLIQAITGSSLVPVVGHISGWRNVSGTKGSIESKMLPATTLMDETPLYVSPFESTTTGSINPSVAYNGNFQMAYGRWGFPDFNDGSYGWDTTALRAEVSRRFRPKSPSRVGPRYDEPFRISGKVIDATGKEVQVNFPITSRITPP